MAGSLLDHSLALFHLFCVSVCSGLAGFFVCTLSMFGWRGSKFKLEITYCDGNPYSGTREESS